MQNQKETSRMNLPKLREWSKDHPWLLVLGDPDGWVTMGATENECLILGLLYEEEPKKVEEALMDPDWVITKQDELNQIERQITLKLIPKLKDKTVIGIWWVFRKKLDEDDFVMRDKVILVAEGYSQAEVSSMKHMPQ